MSADSKTPLSARLRADVECAPWVVHDVRTLETDLTEANARISVLAIENANLSLIIQEAIYSMTHAEVFLENRETMHPTGIKLWSGLLDRMAIAIEPKQECGNESMKSIGGVPSEADKLLHRLENEIENMSIWTNSARDKDLQRAIDTYLKERG